MLFTHIAPHIKSNGLSIGDPSFKKRIIIIKLMLFTRVASRTKSKELPIGGLHLLLVLARASPHTESKWLHRYVLQIYYFINQVSKSFCSSAGVIIPLYHPNKKPSDPDRWLNILLVYSCYQYTRSKGHLFIFIFIKFVQHAKEKDYSALGLSLSSD
jgi:hypothetical protein